MPLKYPIELTSSVRDWDGSFIALAAREKGGSRVVVWKNKRWEASKGADVSDVMRSPEAIKEDLINAGMQYVDWKVLKSPISLHVGIKKWKENFLGKAETIDGGYFFVIWKNSSWIITIQDTDMLLKYDSLPEATEIDLIEAGILKRKNPGFHSSFDQKLTFISPWINKYWKTSFLIFALIFYLLVLVLAQLIGFVRGF